MKKSIFRAAAIVISAALLSGAACAVPTISANSAIVMDGDTQRVLWSHQAGSRSLIASTTKIMTALVVLEECALGAEVKIPLEAVGVEGSSIYLKPGEIMTVEALLYGLMLQSGNDAATALALYCGGSIENFVQKMNDKAVALGLEQTSFANPHGLDSEDNYSTAYDLAKLTSHAMREDTFRTIVSAKTASFGERTFVNHNKLLWRCEGAIGVKTGYTMAAGRILVSCAERNGRRLIVVTISDPNDWRDHCALMDYGFEEYRNVTLASAGAGSIVHVIGGVEDMCNAVLKEDVVYPVSDDECVEIVYSLPQFVYPPLMAGDKAGELIVYIDGVKAAVCPLYWQFTVLEGA